MELRREKIYQHVKTGQFVNIYAFAINGITEEPVVVYHDSIIGGTFIMASIDFHRLFRESSLAEAREAAVSRAG